MVTPYQLKKSVERPIFIAISEDKRGVKIAIIKMFCYLWIKVDTQNCINYLIVELNI